MTQAISTARLELGLKQSELAQKVNEKPTVIQDYESGKAVPSPQILGKLERALKVKLRGMSVLFSEVRSINRSLQVRILGRNWRGQRRRKL